MNNGQLTVGQLIALLQNMDPTLPVEISMRDEYQNRIYAEGVELISDSYVLISDNTGC